MAFNGFPEETLTFLRNLTRHNDKEWFSAHRSEYEAHCLTPAKEFVAAMAKPLRAFAPGTRVEPRVNGSIFRINRDTRFSADKTPYKNHIDLWFWEGERGWDCSGFFLRLLPDKLILGAGIHRLEREGLERYRQAVAEDGSGSLLAKLVAKLRRAGYGIGGEHYAKVPRGFDRAHPRADLLKYNGLHATLEIGIPSEVHTARFPAYCARHYRAMMPLHRWLVSLSATSPARS